MKTVWILSIRSSWDDNFSIWKICYSEEVARKWEKFHSSNNRNYYYDIEEHEVTELDPV